MTRKQVDEIIGLALDVNGLDERHQGVSGNHPTVFVYISGHVAILHARVYQCGYSTNEVPIEFEFYMDDEVDRNQLQRYRRLMKRLLKKMEGQKRCVTNAI